MEIITKSTMYISKNLDQFENLRVLIIVLSSKDAKFYIASNSIIDELEVFQLKEPEYSKDWTVRGGSSKKKGSSINSSYGSRKKSLLTDFLHEFSEHLSSVISKNVISQAFIFCPSYMDRRVRNVLPETFKKNLVKIYRGNYVKQHPFDLLEMIKIDIDIHDVPNTSGI